MKFIALIFCLLMQLSCSSSEGEKESDVSIQIPLVDGCISVINAADNFFKSTFNRNSGFVGIRSSYFDRGLNYSYPIKGVVELYAVGLRSVGHLSIEEYLKVHANGIEAACSPRQKITLIPAKNDNLFFSIKEIEKESKVPLVIKLNGDNVDVYYNNDHSYKYLK